MKRQKTIQVKAPYSYFNLIITNTQGVRGVRGNYYGTFSCWELHRNHVNSSHKKPRVFPKASLCYVIIQPPLSPLYGFFSSGTPLIRGSLGNSSSAKAMVSAQFAATCCSKRRQKHTQLKISWD